MSNSHRFRLVEKARCLDDVRAEVWTDVATIIYSEQGYDSKLAEILLDTLARLLLKNAKVIRA